MSKKATLHDIARELNITASTVSRALNDHERISEDTKKLVKSTAERLGYQVNGVASALRSGRTYIIGVVVPTADRSFFASVVRGIEEEANKSGYNVMICQSNDNYEAEVRNIKAFLKAQVDGVVLSVSRKTQDFEHYKELTQRGIPLIFFDRVKYDMGVSTVTIDDFGGAYKATEHLIKQGCKNIATLIGGYLHVNIYSERFRGFKQAMEDYNLPINEAYILESGLNEDDGRRNAEKLFNLPVPPDAIVCQSDFSAVGAMQYFKEKGIRVPEDVAITGFANEPYTAIIEPSLTTVDQHPVEMGQAVAQLFLEQIENENRQFMPKNITLNADLIIRKSSLKGS